MNALSAKAAELGGGNADLEAEWLERLTRMALARVDRNRSREFGADGTAAIAVLDEMVAFNGETFTDD